MLISPPFLLPRNADETDEAFVTRCMPNSSVMVAGTQAPEGSFPVSFKLGWHGGLHLQAPADANNAAATVRAIADGEIVSVRQPTPRNDTASPAEPRNYNPYGDRPAWTDDGYVIIKHTTEIGADAQNAATTVTFFSIYMHLSQLRGAAHRAAAGVAGSGKVYRKDEIGVAGRVYGNDQQLHFEIVCDDENLQRLIGRRSGELNTAQDGRTDAVYGEMYFRLSVDTKFFAQQPANNIASPTQSAAYTLRGDPLYVGLRYAGGDGAAADRGDAYLTTYQADGTPLGPALNENNAEYNLYATASRISEAYPESGRPAPSAVYELLRFGRSIGFDVLTPADVPHWRLVSYPGGQGWVNLNAAGVLKYSDADHPHWRGWRLIDDDTDADSRCESAQLIALIEDPADKDGKLTRAELERRLPLPEVRERLKRTICKFPGEWDRATAAARWDWLNGDPEFGLQPPDFAELMAHIDALTFPWAAAGTGIDATHWHFNPREFIAHERRCGWLSAYILARIYSDTPAVILNKYIFALNRTMRRYIIQSPLRQSHFIGQGAVESNFMLDMQEASMIGKVEPTRLLGEKRNSKSVVPEDRLGHWYGREPAEDDPWFKLEKYNSLGKRITGSYSWVIGNVGDIDAQKFRGRGFKQLTGLDNYAAYWVYRGLLRKDSFDSNWWSDPQYIKREPTRMAKRPPRIDDPERLSISPENCMDSGGWYMIFRRPKVISSIDGDVHCVAATVPERDTEKAASRAVTFAINGGYIGDDKRLKYTQRAKNILL